MGFNRIRPVDTGRSRHPDLDAAGNFLPDVDDRDRDHNRRWQDPGYNAHAMSNIAGWQSLEHPQVQAGVAGQTYGSSPAEGLRLYREAIDEERRWVAKGEGREVYVDDAMIAENDLAWFDEHFDANGRPKPHVYYYQNRSQWLNDGTDAHSARELRNR